MHYQVCPPDDTTTPFHYTSQVTVSVVCWNRVQVWFSGLCEFALDADTCGYVMVNALHRDSGIGNGVALQVTHEPFDATMNLQKHKHTMPVRDPSLKCSYTVTS